MLCFRYGNQITGIPAITKGSYCKLSIISSSSAKKQSAGVLGGPAPICNSISSSAALTQAVLDLQFVNLDTVQLAAQVT